MEDICPGPEGSFIGSMISAKGRLYFTANDGAHGTEPWVSRGCEDDTLMLGDLRAGPEGSEPLELTALGRKVVFTADDGAHGREPWRSDGTPEGTLLLADITPGPAPGYAPPAMLTAADERVFFYADDPDTGYEPWVTNGTPAGTHLVKDIQPGPGNSISGDPDAIYPVRDGVVAFRAFNTELGSELWWTDGSEAGTRRVDIEPGSESSFPSTVFAAGRWVYFTASAGLEGSERSPWRASSRCGTPATTGEEQPEAHHLPSRVRIPSGTPHEVRESHVIGGKPTPPLDETPNRPWSPWRS